MWQRVGVLFFCFFAHLLIAGPALSKIKVPSLTGPVVDQAGILPDNLRAKLELALQDLQRQTGTQLNVLTVDSLQGEEIESFSIQVTDAWKLGAAKSDRGVLLLVAPRERKLRIEVGQGLEGDLSDLRANRIISDSMTPLFKNGDLPSGILVGVFQIVKTTDPDFNLAPYFDQAEPRVQPASKKKFSDWWVLGLLLLFLFIHLGGGRRRGSSVLLPGLAGALLGGLGGGRGGRGGSGWGGGGGGFSGGGASGSW